MSQNALKNQILGWWKGKAIGGTLGIPYEGVIERLFLTLYDPVPQACLPNDDLDLQVLYDTCLLEKDRISFDPNELISYWFRHVRFAWDEYGVLFRNHSLGIRGERTGATDNWFGESMGAAIRSELWACNSSGQPERATGFAWTDAVCDHCGDGVWAEVFLAAKQALAFQHNDIEKIIFEALAYLPKTSRVGNAVRTVADMLHKDASFHSIRERLVDRFGRINFTDTAINLGLIALGLLGGKGDFERSILLAVNCGSDTDYTGATVGAALGIMDPDCIPIRWLEFIGVDAKLSAEIVNLSTASTLGKFTDQALELKDRLADFMPRWGEVFPSQQPAYDDPVGLTLSVSLLYGSETSAEKGLEYFLDTAGIPNDFKTARSLVFH